MSQPKWKYIANLGDATPLEYGGKFLYVDKTGVYPPELEILEEPCERKKKYTAYRIILENYDKESLEREWFAKDLEHLARSVEMTREELVNCFCSSDARERAFAVMEVCGYWGEHEFDHYPLTLTRTECHRRYRKGELK